MRVITYTDPRRLERHPDWPEIAGTVHICATESLNSGLQDYYRAAASGGVPKILSISTNMLFGKILDEWSSPRAQVKQYARVTGVIDRIRVKTDEESERLRAFRRNQAEVLDAIRTLSEGGLDADALRGHTPEERLFQEIWRHLESEDRTLQYLRSRIKALGTAGTMLQAVLQAFADAGEALRVTDPDAPGLMQAAAERVAAAPRFILHGFYFITPLQKQMITLLEQAGFEIIYLNCWDGRRAPLFTAWEPFFEGQTGSQDGPEPEDAGRYFASVYTGAPSAPPPPHLRILRFPDLGAFLEHVQEELDRENEREQPRFCTPMADDLNDMLREFYPERYPDRHFLAYPVGQLLFHLHLMWDEQKEELRLSPQGLFACFTSGLLQVQIGDRAVDGLSMTGALRKALPYFAGCEYLREWRARGQQLRTALTQTVPRWDVDPGDLPGDETDRYHAMLTNPLRRISYLQLSPQQVTDLLALMERLFQMAEEIFAEQEVSMSRHMKRLERMLREGGTSSSLEQEEHRLVRELLQTLQAAAADDEPMPTKDLAAAIAFYIGNVGKQKDRALVSPLEALDGLPLRNRSRPIHLCLLSEEQLPAHRKAVPWPLTRDSFADPDQPAVQMLLRREESAPYASLYLFYSALAFCRQVTLSYVARWEAEPKEESLYLLMLEVAGVKPKSAPYGPWRRLTNPSWDYLTLGDEVTWAPALYPMHAAAEFAICPRRFYYSYFAAEGPAIASDFHQEYLYPALSVWHRLMTDGTHRHARAFLDPLFPQFTQTRKQDLLERYGAFSPRMDSYDGWDYPRVLRRVLIPNFTKLDPARAVFDTPGRYETVLAEIAAGPEEPQMEAKAGHHCRFCPHSSHCSAAAFPADDDGANSRR